MTLVKSQLVLNAALEDRGVGAFRMIRKQADPVAWLQDNLEVGFVGGSEVMRIALSGNNADEVAGIVNAVKKAYLEEVVNVELKRQSERHDTLKKLKNHYAEILHQRRGTLEKLAESVPSDDGLAAVEAEKADLLVSHTLWSKHSNSGWNRPKRKLCWLGGRTSEGPRLMPSARRLFRSKTGLPS